MLRIFIDGTWLWHNAMHIYSTYGRKINHKELPSILTHLTSESLYEEALLYASIPINVDKRDLSLVEKRKYFFEMLENKCGP